MPIPNSVSGLLKMETSIASRSRVGPLGRRQRNHKWGAELLALKACLKTMMPKTQPGHSDLSLRLVDLQFSLYPPLLRARTRVRPRGVSWKQLFRGQNCANKRHMFPSPWIRMWCGCSRA